MANFGPKKRILDEDVLHRYLFERTDRHQQILVNQLELAEGLGVVRTTLWFTFKRMISDGRMRLVRKNRSGQNTYYIANPDGEEKPKSDGPTTTPQPQRVMWQ